MQSRITDRKNQYKKTFDEPRRWREDVMTQIRKDTRTEALNKRRQGLTTQDDNQVQTIEQGPTHSSMTEAPRPLSDDEIHMRVQEMKSGDAEVRFRACESIRKALSIEQGPPIDTVIEAGAVPVLMQFLRQEHEVNLQFEAAWSLTNIASGNPDQTKHVIDHGGIEAFCTLLASPSAEMREQAIWAIGNLSGDNINARNRIIELGALDQIKKLIHGEQSNFHLPDRIPFLVNCTWTISNLLRGKPCPPFDVTNMGVNLIHKLIYLNSPEIQSDCCWAISYITDGSTSAVLPVDSELPTRINDVLFVGLGFRCVELLSSPVQSVQVPALRCVGNIVTGTDEQTQTMILCGVINALGKLIKHTNLTIQKEAVWAISNIAAGNRSQIQEIISNGLIPPLIERLQHAEFEVRKEAAWSLSNALSGGNSQQVATIVKYGCIEPLCNILSVHDERNILVVLDAIGAILKHGQADMRSGDLEENPYAALLEQAGGYDRLEYLSGHPAGTQIQIRATEIIRTYLEFDDEEEIEDADNSNNVWSFN